MDIDQQLLWKRLRIELTGNFVITTVQSFDEILNVGGASVSARALVSHSSHQRRVPPIIHFAAERSSIMECFSKMMKIGDEVGAVQHRQMYPFHLL